MARSSRRSLFLVVFFLLACGFLGILFAQRTGQQSSLSGDSDVKDSLKQFTDVYAVIEENYAEPVNPDKAIYTGLSRACCTRSIRTRISSTPSPTP
jgi:carboxyl-terminal processing protease